METKQSEYFIVKISCEDFLNVMTTLYGPVTSLKFEWVEDVYQDIDGKWNAQLHNITKNGITETGIEYETDLWDFYYRDEEIAEFEKLENLFSISVEISKFTNSKLPLSAISVKSTDLEGDNRMPNSSSAVWLHYGDMG